jgi:hypothetical protein
MTDAGRQMTEDREQRAEGIVTRSRKGEGKAY